jgi:hypothetical protein
MEAKIDLQIRLISADGMNAAAVHWNRRTLARPAGGSAESYIFFCTPAM